MRRAIAAAFVEHVGGDRGEPGPARRDRTPRRPASAARTRRSGTCVVLDGPDPQAVRQRRFRRSPGNGNGRLGAGHRAARRSRSTRHHETATGCEPASASATSGRAARRSASRARRVEYVRDRLPRRLGGDALVALQIAVEVAGIAEKDVVGVQLIGLAAEAADGLQPEQELRFGLRPAALDLVVGRPVGRRAARSPRGSPARARRACARAPRSRRSGRSRPSRASSATPRRRWRCAAS